MKKAYFILIAVLLLCFALPAQASTGMVLTVQEGAWVIRDGEKIKLEVKSEILAGDELVTDDTGRVQILFADDTTISLGADTEIAIAEFIFDEPGKKPSFASNMVKGAARFVTGKVVEQNRSGFSVTTPQATVGIRGTTFAVSVSDKGLTSVVGLNVNGAFPISVTNSKTGVTSVIDQSGMGVDASPAGNTSYQTPPGQFSQSNSQVNGSSASLSASSDTTGTQTSASGSPADAQAAAPDSPASTDAVPAMAEADTAPASSVGNVSPDSGAAPAGPAMAQASSPEPPAAQELALSNSKTPEQILEDLGQNAPPSLGQPPVLPPVNPGVDPSTLTGHYQGTIYNAPNSPHSPVGNFQFNVGLSGGSAKITGTELNITSSYGSGLKAVQNGESAVSGGQFNTQLTVSVPGSNWGSAVGDSGYMNGQFRTGDTVDGKWKIDNVYSNEMYFDGSK